MQWYYAEGGKQVGPVSEADLQNLVRSGRITPKTLVWHAGMAGWAAYETLPQEPAQSETPAAQAGPDATGVCQECGKTFPLSDMITYQGASICASCKPAFFQRMQEGAAPGKDGGGEGNTPNRELMAYARTVLSGRWGLAIGVVVVQFLISIAAGIIPFGVGNIISFLIAGPLSVGMAVFFLAISRGEEAQFSMLFSGFQRFGTALGAYFFMGLFILLWCLLLIVPGIIAAYSYSMTFYVVADDSSVGALEAIKRSKEMMRGKKWKFFCLNFRFIGWALLCILTCGIGFLWLVPYISTSCARFYDDVRGRVVT